MIGRPVRFNFDGPPPPPDWLIHGLIERGTVTVISADSGVGKSLVCMAMTVSIIQGRPWAGRRTSGGRVLVVDEENFLRVVHSRLYALGMRNEDREALEYYLRAGVCLGTEEWDSRVSDAVRKFRPDLVIIDTAAAATAVEVSDNTGVAKLFRDSLRPLAEVSAVALLHHERKPPQQQGRNTPRNAGHAMMGARQWAGQADGHIALEKLGQIRIEPGGDGTITRTLRLKMEMPKDRNGQQVNEQLAIVSVHEKGDTGFTQPLSLKVERAA